MGIQTGGFPKYDVRVIRMAKSTPTTTLISSMRSMKLANRINACVCLGHFDVMTLDAINSDNSHTPLEAVRKDSDLLWNLACVSRGKCDGQIPTMEENYYYPIYLVKQLKNNKGNSNYQSINDFWSWGTNYIGVTRFHQDRTTYSENNSSFAEILSDRLMNITNPVITEATMSGEVVILEVRPHGGKDVQFGVQCIFYDSLELGDVVAVIKCDSITATLEIQRHLCECPAVSNAYSYCGLNYGLFLDSPELNLNSIKNREKLIGINLDYVSTRFSVKNAQTAWRQMDKISYRSDAGYVVTGNADVIIDCCNLSEINLIETMVNIVGLGDELYKSFNDVITRVGLKNREPNFSRMPSHYQSERSTTLAIDNGLNQWLIRKITESIPPRGETYTHSLQKLVSTLETMRENCVMDDLSDLVYPGVEAFISRLKYLRDIDEWSEGYTEELLEFLEDWTSITNSILHLESQMVQHPELMPVRYYIPAMVLQFEQRLVEQCVESIQQVDKGANSFAPIIFPRAQKGTTTKAIFDPKEDRNFKGKSPLCIVIPIHQLYSPWEVAHILCHEVAHYCGGEIRFRKKRFDCLVESIADYLMHLWEMLLDLSGASVVSVDFRGCRNGIIGCICSNYPAIDGDDTKFLNAAKEGLLEATELVIKNADAQNQFLSYYLKVVEAAEQIRLIYKSSLDGIAEGHVALKYVESHLEECLIPLYRECFADIMMICLLDCSFKDYYVCVYEQEYRYLMQGTNVEDWDLDESLSRRAWLEHHCDRMALVSLAISSIPEKGGWYKEIKDNDIEKRGWVVAASEKITEWKRYKYSDSPEWRQYYVEERFIPTQLLGFEAKKLLEYLSECAQAIWNGIHVTNKTGTSKEFIDQAQEVQAMLACLQKESFDWEKLKKYLIDKKMSVRP